MSYLLNNSSYKRFIFILTNPSTCPYVNFLSGLKARFLHSINFASYDIIPTPSFLKPGSNPNITY